MISALKLKKSKSFKTVNGKESYAGGKLTGAVVVEFGGFQNRKR